MEGVGHLGGAQHLGLAEPVGLGDLCGHGFIFLAAIFSEAKSRFNQQELNAGSIQLNLKQLRSFCEVVDAGNARAAAEKLFIAPTAISMQLALLEE
ncbi:MAG: LysR family transcriptional regulator [Comamonadaceae bacterium]|nr:MAG: LysR family transcriptional regulator [Comamonadaceae bacterium]